MSSNSDFQLNDLNRINNGNSAGGNFQSEKCLNIITKYNLCLLEEDLKLNKNKINNSNNNSYDKTPRSNKEFLNSDFDFANENKFANDDLIKLKKYIYDDADKNLKTNLRHSNTNYDDSNTRVFLAEKNKDVNWKIVKNLTVRENQDSPVRNLKINNRLQINGGNIILCDSNNNSLNSNLEENKNAYSLNVLHQDKANSSNYIMEVNNSNINNNNNKSFNPDYVKIPISGNKFKKLYNRNESSESKKIIENLKSKKESTIMRNLSIKNNQNIEIITNNDNKINLNNELVNRISSKSNFQKEAKTEKRESEAVLLNKNENNQINNIPQILNINNNINNNNDLKKILVEKRDVQIDNLLSESKTRILLTESITKKVILLILSLVIFLPILSEEVYRPDGTDSYNILAQYISNYKTIMPEKYERLIPEFILNEVDENYPIIKITDSNGILIYRNDSLRNTSFRYSEIDSAISPAGDVVILYSVFYENQFSAMLSIIKTLFVCLSLLIATVYFEKDTKKLVLDPLEIMIEIVEMVSKDPIKAKDLDNFNFGAKSTYLQMQFFDEKKLKKFQKQKEKSEVKIIQLAIKKIAALLAIGLGEAGNEIIKENLSTYNDLDPMIKGRKKKAIFGFCDIRDFPVVNEALQENTVVFLNQIADIVHSSVDLFFGATNKNIGDAFLSVWKMPNNVKSNSNGNLVESNKNLNDFNKELNLIGRLNKVDSEIEKKFFQQKDLAENSIKDNMQIVIEKQKNSSSLNQDKSVQIENQNKKNEEIKIITNKENKKITGK